MMAVDVTVTVKQRTTLGEGAVWDNEARRLYWVDILEGLLFRYDPATGRNKAFKVGQPVGALVPYQQSVVMLAVQQGFARFDLEREQLTLVASPQGGMEGMRFNDGKCDPAGRFWAGTMSMEMEENAGALYRLDADGSLHLMRSDLTIPNGIAWTRDGKTMYHIDTTPRTLSAYDFDLESGTIRNHRVVLHYPEEMGFPDGMTMDEEGMLWIAEYGGSCVRRWDPVAGKALQKIELPVSKVTSCAFGGPDLTTLYITTATEKMSDEEKEKEPLAGSLFEVTPGVRGMPANRYG